MVIGNGCHRRLHYYNEKLNKLKEVTPTFLPDTIKTIADKLGGKTARQHHAQRGGIKTNPTSTYQNKMPPTEENGVQNTSCRPLDKTETQVLSYIRTETFYYTEDIVSSVEVVLARRRELPESNKGDIRSRVASTLQLASLTNCKFK